MSRFDGFSGEEFIAEGGLGRVWRAQRDSTGGVVAIKEIKQLDVGSPAWHRARREVEALVRLKGHPNVVSVEEIISGPDGPALVMEYLDSGSLADRIAQGPMTADDALRIGQAILTAIAAAHEVGIIHRDLKPHNVLLGKYGQVKVCDFGIAAIAREGERTMTSASTLAYASPEELDGSAVGPPADVYSFCVTMIHAITGTRPTFAERLTGNITFPPDITSNHPALTQALLAGLATDPTSRPTTNDLQSALATSEQSGVVRPARRDGTVPAPDLPIPSPGGERVGAANSQPPLPHEGSTPTTNAEPASPQTMPRATEWTGDIDKTVPRVGSGIADTRQPQDPTSQPSASAESGRSRRGQAEPTQTSRGRRRRAGVLASIAGLTASAFVVVVLAHGSQSDPAVQGADSPLATDPSDTPVVSSGVDTSGPVPTSSTVEPTSTPTTSSLVPNSVVSQPAPTSVVPTATIANPQTATTVRPTGSTAPHPTTPPPTTPPPTTPPPTTPPPTTPPPSSTVTISLVGPTEVANCNSMYAKCYWIVGNFSGFTGTVTVVCWADGEPFSTFSTSSSGFSIGKCWVSSGPGGFVWVTVNGVRSNVLVRPL